eukprot:TRINITY_DN466_c0_g1_i1.p1 TRINITY_DN466_c0_g1~~TRINITY_DN466_c0_g1_i1.p1  ORF type:complete len:247 (-),score=96.39 TRINITY_DN466_c0_g1_i1:42-782(-)
MTNSEGEKEKKEEKEEGYQVIFKEGLLSAIDQKMDSFPASYGDKYGVHTKQVDLSYNSLTKIENLSKFTKLTSLVLDNNQLESKQDFPKNPNLQTLWVNNNNITDLKEFIDCIQKAFPNINYLSMMKNPACPNYFTGKDAEDYQRYRYYVLHKLRKLKFLDSSPVTEKEKKEAIRIGPYMITAKPAQQQQQQPQAKNENENVPKEEYSSSPPPEPEGKGKTRIGVASYVYHGKHSEGNRFIMNQDL